MYFQICLCFAIFTVTYSCDNNNKTGDYCGMLVYGAKQPYEWLPDNSKDIMVKEDSLMNCTFDNQLYTAVYVDATIRHGARWPTQQNMERFNVIAQLLSNSSLAYLDNWNNTFTSDKAMQLSQVGIREMEYLGNVVGTVFSTLLRGNKQGQSYISSNKKRCEDSAYYFSKTLNSNTTIDKDDFFRSLVLNNTMIRHYDECNEYNSMVQADSYIFNQVKVFREQYITTQTLENLNTILDGGKYNISLGKYFLVVFFPFPTDLRVKIFREHIMTQTCCPFRQVHESGLKIDKKETVIEQRYETNVNQLSVTFLCTQ